MVGIDRWPVAVVAALAAGLAGGCSEGAGAAARPSSGPVSPSSAIGSPSATPSPTATPTGPAAPAAAREQTYAGAQAFVRFYFDQLNLALMTATPEAIRSLSTSDCRFCDQNIGNVEKMAQKGERYSSEPVTLENLRPAPGAPEGQVFISLRIVQQGAAVVSDTGAVIRRDDKASGESLVGVAWTGAGWQLVDVEVA